MVLAAPGSRCLRSAKSPRLLPCSIFPHFTSIGLTIDNFILSQLGFVPVYMRADPGPGPVWILSPLAFRSGCSRLAGLSLVAQCKRQASLLLFIYPYQVHQMKPELPGAIRSFLEGVLSQADVAPRRQTCVSRRQTCVSDLDHSFWTMWL